LEACPDSFVILEFLDRRSFHHGWFCSTLTLDLTLPLL
jgi:hypothetical protein